ncbi:MAG TPA: DsbA family protein [Candidatus Dormibacteraeota bacterium]
MLQRVKETGSRDFQVRWRYFSLSQVNSKVEGWTIWGDRDGEGDFRGRASFMAAEAARRQDRFEPFHMELLRQRHEVGRPIDDPEALNAAATVAGLDLGRFERDRKDPATLQMLAADHQEAVTRHWIFGTPTFVMAGGESAYVRVRPAPEDPSEAVALFDDLVDLVGRRPYVLEVKRPNKPAST